MKKNILVLLFAFVLCVNIFPQSESCDYVLRSSAENPDGYYLGKLNPFAPNTLIEFGVPDTSKVNISIVDSSGISVYKAACTLPGGKYNFDWVFLPPNQFYVFELNCDMDRNWISKMHFEGSSRIAYVK